MRASKKGVHSQNFRNNSHESAKMSPKETEVHISGAEGIYDKREISKIVKNHVLRAFKHPNGIPDKVVITMEEIRTKPKSIQSLPVTTLDCSSPLKAKKIINDFLKVLCISETAIKTAFNVLSSPHTMRGASIVLANSGKRAELDIVRGIRASKLGIAKKAERILSLKLSKRGINSTTVKEAIILASKVASCKQVVAELCISDDPDYTTGYISSKKYGYVRIPNIKKNGEKKGGRVFFLEEDADVSSATKFLEKTPVIINKVSNCRSVCSSDEILNNYHK